MVYICERCSFTFKRVDFPDACPDCGSANLREATEDERHAFEAEQKQNRTEQK